MDLKCFFILNCFCLLILYFNPFVEGDNIPYGLCVNAECSEPISKGLTTLRYSSPDDNRISVLPNEEVLIYVKDFGPKKDLWGVIVNEKRGYISKSFIRETNLFAKELVPAFFDFKVSLPSIDSFTISNHLHPSSQIHESGILKDAGSQSALYSQTVQQGSINSAPSSVQQEWNSEYTGFSENLQASHLSPNLDSSHNVQYDPSSQLYNVPEQSSHFHIHSESILHSSHMAGALSDNILPSPTPVPTVKHSSLKQPHYDDPKLTSPHFQSSLVNEPNLDFSYSESFDSGSDFPRQSFQTPNQNPSSAQQQQFHSSLIADLYSALPSIDDFDDDYSKTLAMLSEMGVDNTDMYTNQDHLSHQSSQSVENNFGLSNSEFNPSSQSQYLPIQSNDASFYSPHINQNTQLNEMNAIKYSDIPVENINTNNEVSENFIPGNAQSFGRMTNEEIGENAESELHTETEDYKHGVHKEKDELIDTPVVDDLLKQSKDLGNTESEFDLQSSMTSAQINQHTSKDINSLSENSMMDPTLVDIPSQEPATSIQHEETYISLNEPSSLHISSIPQETKVIEESSISQSIVESSMKESSTNTHFQSSNTLKVTESSTIDAISTTINAVMDENSEMVHKKVEVVVEHFPNKEIFSDVLDRNNNDALIDSNMYNKEHTTAKINDFYVESEQNSDMDPILSGIDIDEIGEDLATYQVRNLKGEFGATEEQQTDSDGSSDENATQSDESDSYSSVENWFDSLKSIVDSIMSWIPEPLYSALMDLQNKGISPRVPVFTAVIGFVSIFLIVPVLCIKEWSKESRLSAQLAKVEKDAYTMSATNTVLEEKLESVRSELVAAQASLAEEKCFSENFKTEFENQSEELENIKTELESCLEVIDALKDKENDYLTLMNDHEKQKECYVEHKDSLDKIMKDQENSIASLNDQLQEYETNLQKMGEEKEQFLQMKVDYEEKLAQFDRNCNQLLQEAEVWNIRVKELTEEVNENSTAKEEFMTTLKDKDEEIESLKELVDSFKLFDEIDDDSEEQSQNKEEKLQSLLNNVKIVSQLKKEEEKSKILDEQLGKEKNRILDMEVELLEAKSEIDKLKMNYNQALQDKAEAQTKLDVLTNYFKDKEIQLQRQLGAQEAVRQKKEEDANSAERKICLIDQENASYKSQVASMKQEMEETERTLRSQIAAQEKKAHENWIAARAAERKLEDMKQEVTQLRQRLTLLEREQESWANASRDEILKPVPKRMPGLNDESGSQDLNTSERGMYPPPPLLDRLPLVPPMMLPPDRPLPPLPPPHIPPMFLPHMERHYRPQPWHMPPEHSSDYRTTPPEFMTGRASTPPRGRQPAITDGDNAPHTSSPLTADNRDSRNSTPPHLLPDFHDLPPQPGRPFFPPPLGRPRFPMHPMHRRDPGPEPKRLDNPNEFNSRGPQQPPPSEQWQHSRV